MTDSVLGSIAGYDNLSDSAKALFAEVLQDQVGAAVSGRELQLTTEPRDGDYLLSWAVADQPNAVHILQDSQPDWLDRLAEILGKE